MKEHKKTTWHLQKYTADAGYSSCVLLFLPCFCPFFRSILNWNEVLQKVFPSFLFFFGGFLNHLPNRRRTRLLCWRWTLFARGMNAFCSSDERFSAGDECVENARSNLSPLPLHTHSYICSYQRLSNRNSFEITTHRCSRSKASGRYHAFVLTSKNATPTSYISNSVPWWTKRPSSRLSWWENNKWTFPYTPSSLYCTCSVVQAWPDFTCRAHTIIAWKAKKRTYENMKRLGGSF